MVRYGVNEFLGRRGLNKPEEPAATSRTAHGKPMFRTLGVKDCTGKRKH